MSDMKSPYYFQPDFTATGTDFVLFTLIFKLASIILIEIKVTNFRGN